MKVIKPIYYKTTCTKCATRIEFQLDETVTIDKYSYWNKYIICPTCGLEIKVQKMRWQDTNVELDYAVEPVYEDSL